MRDVAALGDCAVLAVLCHPNFTAPLSDVQELRRAVVSFARGPRSAECKHVFTVLKNVADTTFEVFLESVLKPRFWVGTEFFAWVTMLYGVDIGIHFFSSDKLPSFQSTAMFLRDAFPNSSHPWSHSSASCVHVFFHQYKQMTSVDHPMYNHFAMLIPFPICPNPQQLLNDLIAAKPEHAQWWHQKKTPDAMKDAPGNEKKERIIKKNLSAKVERKQKQTFITTAYVKWMCVTHKKAAELQDRLDAARERALELAKEHQIQVDELDLPVASKSDSDDEGQDRLSKSRSLTPKNCKRSWIQRSYIIYMHLHPNIGRGDMEYTCALVGVNQNTLSGWLTKPSLISCWLPIVSSFNVHDVLNVLPEKYQNTFVDIDGSTILDLQKYERLARKDEGVQLKISFARKNVSVFSLSCFIS